MLVGVIYHVAVQKCGGKECLDDAIARGWVKTAEEDGVPMFFFPTSKFGKSSAVDTSKSSTKTKDTEAGVHDILSGAFAGSKFGLVKDDGGRITVGAASSSGSVGTVKAWFVHIIVTHCEPACLITYWSGSP